MAITTPSLLLWSPRLVGIIGTTQRYHQALNRCSATHASSCE